MKTNFLDWKNEKIQKLLKEIIEILEKHLGKDFTLYIFGSFATGKATFYSDLDLALETKANVSNIELAQIKEDLENIRTLRKIDLIYLNDSPQTLKEVVKKEGVLIYGSRR